MWQRKRVSVWFITLVIISIILIGIGGTESGVKLQLKTASLFTPFHRYASFLFNTFKIRRENRSLKQALAKLALKNQRLTMYEYENKRLKSLLEFKDQEKYELITARIVGKLPDPIAGTCIINKGKAHGIERGTPVITPDGIYGKVLDVTKNTAVVQTLFHFNFRASAMNLRNGTQGIVRWEPGKGCIFEQVPVNSDIKAQDMVVTSGIGSVFPKGLKIGEVEKVMLDKTKLYYSIPLKPFCKFAQVEVVFVVKKPGLSSKRSEEPIYETLQWKIYYKKKIGLNETTAIEKENISTPETGDRFPIVVKIPAPVIRKEPQN